MNRARLLIIPVLAAACVPVLAAQETPPADTEAVSLAYRFRTGQLQRFRGSINTNMTMSTEGGAFGPIPIDTKVVLGFTEKVIGTREGTGTLVLALDSFRMGLNLFGSEVQVKLLNGKLQATSNGQPLPEGAGGPAAMLQNAVPTRPVTIRRSPRGLVTTEGAPSPGLDLLTSASLELPEQPVKVNDTWETVQTVRPAAPGPLGAAGGAPQFQLSLTHTLKALETTAGRRIAVIESAGSGSSAAEAGQPPAASQSYTATTRFDVGRGAVVGVNARVDMKMRMGAPGGPVKPAAQDPGQLSGGQLDGSVEIRLEEAPAAAPGGASAPKPGSGRRPAAPKKPVRRR